MTGRSRIGNRYVQRDARGRFVKWTSIPRGIAVDSRKKVRQRTKRGGYGHKQDYRRNR